MMTFVCILPLANLLKGHCFVFSTSIDTFGLITEPPETMASSTQCQSNPVLPCQCVPPPEDGFLNNRVHM